MITFTRGGLTMKKLCDMTIEELSFLREHDIIEAEAVNDEIMIRKATEYQEKYNGPAVKTKKEEIYREQLLI